MRRQRVVLVLAGAALVWCAAPLAVTAAPAAQASVRAGTWRTAIKVPGLWALNQGGQALLTSVSCASAGNCAAGGTYTDGSGHTQAFVVREVNGTWRGAFEVPGSGVLNADGVGGVNSVSCASAGNCAAAGSYTDGSGHRQAFVASETNGIWRKAIEVPGLGGLNQSGSASVSSVSCASAGNCAAGGFYRDSSNSTQAFVVSETEGIWGTAIEVPSSGIVNWAGSASVSSVSCASAGNCAAVGDYRDFFGHSRAFVVREKDGTWGKTIALPGSAIQDEASAASVSSVSCASAGNCAAGGAYTDGSGHTQAFVVSKANGVWGTAVEVPGTGALNAGGFAVVTSLSCRALNNCTAGGFYMDGSDHEQVFAVSETNGTWGNAIEIPGSGALNAGDARLTSVSCASAGNCAAGGTYTDGSGHTQAFVVSQA